MTGKKQLTVVSKRGFNEGESRAFECRVQGKKFKGLVVKKNGKFFAYENLCMHLPIPLDLEDDNFFSFDKAFLQCQMHGALYEIETGKCVGGPCLDSQLRALPLHEEASRIIIEIEVKGV